MIRDTSRCCAIALGALLGGGAAAQAIDSPTIEEVIITAQKRSEALQSVPLSVSALEQKQLERMGVDSVAALAREVPGLTVITAGAGQNVLIMRGIASSAGTAGTVGYYIDDIPVSASSNASLLAIRGLMDPTVFDLARVEVLRGPQGTLYGSSSMGGTVRYLTARPDLARSSARAGGTLSATAGGGWNQALQAMLNLPIEPNRLAVRLAASWRRDSGFIERYPIDPQNYLAASPGAQFDVNSQDNKEVRAALKWRVGERWTVNASLLTQSVRQDAPSQIDRPPGDLGHLIQTRLADEPTRQDSSLANLALHAKFDRFELVSSTSYFARDVNIVEDSSKVLYYFLSPKPQDMVYPVTMQGEYRNREWSEELRATSNFAGPVELVGGAFYRHVAAPLASAIPVPAGYNTRFGTTYDSFFHGGRQATVREQALFGEGSWAFAPHWSAHLGLRAFRVAQGFAQQGDGVLNGGPSAVTGDSDDRGFNPKLGLDWQPRTGLLLFANASKGYRAGGPNNPAPASVCGQDLVKLGLSEEALRRFAADTLWSYELGLKTNLGSPRLTVNAALYRMDWKQVQQQIVLGCGFNITANFGAARSQGAELELAWKPSPQLSLRLMGNHTDAQLLNDVPGSPARKGDTLLEVPRWSAAAAAEYTVPLEPGRSAYARLDYSYVGAAKALYDRTSPFYARAGFGQFKLRLGVEPLAGQGWSAALFVDNLFNRIGQTALPVAISADLPTTRRIAVTRPRTIGVTLRRNF